MEEKNCLECGINIPIRKWYAHVKFCSIKCKGKYIRKTEKYKEQQTRLRKEWAEKNKERLKIYRREWERKNYKKRREHIKIFHKNNPNYNKEYLKRFDQLLRLKKWRESQRGMEIIKKAKQKFNKKNPNYWKEVYNPLKHKVSVKKYTHSDKGKATWWRRYDEKRKRNLTFLGKKIDLPDRDTIKMIRERDKFCFYCNCNFDYGRYSNPKYPSFDHINRNLPLNKINAVICCRSCNSSKSDTDVLIWLDKKGIKPSKVLLDLLEKQRKYIELMS